MKNEIFNATKGKTDMWKALSIIAGFVAQLIAIIWWVSTMNGNINANTREMSTIRTDVRDVRERVIRLEGDVENLSEDLREHRGTERIR